MCIRCKPGSLADGGAKTDPSLGCLLWCSRAGYCGDGEAYRRGLDCRKRTDVTATRLMAAREATEKERAKRYHPKFIQKHGRDNFQQHIRAWDHAELYGRAISIRGERHCGTGWVRIMTNKNCQEIRHFWSPKLDSDGLYNWKHDYLPNHFDPRSKDCIIIVFRSAVPWVPKMKRAAYSNAIDRFSTKPMGLFLATSFKEFGKHYHHILHLRSSKYAQYLNFATSHPNVLGVRYEDLLIDPIYLFASLANDLGFSSCNHHPSTFHYIRSYAKFGAISKSGTAEIRHSEEDSFRPRGSTKRQTLHKKSSSPNLTWTFADWNALIDRLDHSIESNLAYSYDRSIPGRWHVLSLPDHSPVLNPIKIVIDR